MNKQKLLINGKKLKNTLEEFANFGRTKNNGVTRLSLSEEDRLVRDYFCSCCKELGMSFKIDDMGNIYATLEGIESKPPIVLGSHMDTVKKGGRFDGILGVAAGIEVVRTLVENNIKPRIPVMVVNFTNEEGARFEPSMMASGVLSGKFEKSIMLKKTDTDGITFEEALNTIGYAGDIENRLKEATAFLELHIEQGPILERESLTIGVVECILGMVCYDIEITGESDHAGTTPMDMRKDALFEANNVITKLREKLSNLDKELVYTMGRMNVSPNIHTVIPNKVIFSVEARHKNPEVIKQVEEIIQAVQSAPLEGCEITTTKLWGRDTVWFDEEVIDLLEQSTKLLRYPYKRMVSGAGHDAQFIASYIPSAMIFIPSINGKSHSEDELTTWEDCENGVNVLLETVLAIQFKKN
ncbi:Zn-dependent hydrolase [Cytobacillus depressus]|uniref:Zn-dependent hydrolase n=1 Tax=Cytobacillus depressus TaxID=1602942 RepID=A0A6L3V8U8_9BACI|nr:Zn-dependent hydrolase [Cytobacillus depressus]KAB2338030.1 Zn-dependent hydrolase [Cytobacillus depressus]